MSHFPRLQDFSPANVGFTCVHPCMSQEGRRCTNKVNKLDREEATKIRARVILLVMERDSLQQALREYALLCCCKGLHRKRAGKLDFLNEVASQWLSELTTPISVPLDGAVFAPAIRRFLPYEPKEPKDNFGHILCKPLNGSESLSGTLYMIRRHEDPGFVKIGITYKVADDRFAFFTSSCGFVPIPLRQIRHIPSVKRLERLVHAELTSYRRECTTCTRRTSCGALHNEWFEGVEDRGLDVMEKLARWMIYADPYGADGCLKSFWMDIYHQIGDFGQLPTSDSLLNALEAQEASEDALATSLSTMSIGKKLLNQPPPFTSAVIRTSDKFIPAKEASSTS